MNHLDIIKKGPFLLTLKEVYKVKRLFITYGTFDLLHWGLIKLLECTKELGDYFWLQSDLMNLICRNKKSLS